MPSSPRWSRSSGSAYTYAYATLGEFVAWIIGWDLILEYAIGNVAVAISWANYFNTLLRFRHRFSGLAVDRLPHAPQRFPDCCEQRAAHLGGCRSIFNLLAFGDR